VIFATVWPGSRSSIAIRCGATIALISRYGSDTILRPVQRVGELMRQEQTCCAFLTFEMHEQTDTVILTIKAPEEARSTVDTLFGGVPATEGSLIK
jgi:hypothetical protein